jgi:pimeloyl-ACP methyl ester carboxylesterase
MTAGGEGSELLLGTAVVSRGLVFVATDYEGLGPPGVHTYLVGQSEGRAVLDSIRAARQLLELAATTKAVVWGHSQGGGAALWAAELAPTYAPDGNVLGSVAGAPAAELAAFGASLGETTSFGFQLMAIAGFHAAYPELPLDQVVTAEGAAAVEAAGNQCTAETFAAVSGQDPGRFFQPGAASASAWLDALAANDPGHGRTNVPIFVYHGDADVIVPVQVSEIVAEAYCANEVTVSRKVYPGADHTNVIIAALGDINAYVDARLAGQPAASTC